MFADETTYDYAPNYNIAPDSFQPVVRLNKDKGDRELTRMSGDWRLTGYGWRIQEELAGGAGLN